MFKNIIAFSIANAHQRPDLAQVEKALGTLQFAPCGATQASSSGWVPPRGVEHAALAEGSSGHILVRLCTETKILPGSVVKDKLVEKCEQIEQTTGRKPGKKHMRELKDEVVQELLPQAFTKRAFTDGWLDFNAGLLVLDLSSASRADDFITLLIKSFTEKSIPLMLSGVHTSVSPSVAMANWLREQEAPSPFSIDRECELKTHDELRSKVKYSSHALDIQEVVAHIDQGKTPTKLAMTWNGRVSFELCDTLQLRKVSFLDVVFEGRDDSREDAFDADAAIATGELGPMLKDLIEALGGLMPFESSQTDGGDTSGAQHDDQQEDRHAA